jgi:hypothetical protein
VHHKKPKTSIAQHDKPLDPHSADAIGNAGDKVGDGADPSVDVDKEKTAPKASDDEQQSTSQTDQEDQTEAPEEP